MLKEQFHRLLVETVFVQVLDEQFPDPAELIIQGFKFELPKEMFLEGFGPGKSAFDEFVPFRALLIPPLTDKTGIRTGLEIIILLLPGSIGLIQGEYGMILKNLKSRISFNFFLYSFP
jgi:hypothetical protein